MIRFLFADGLACPHFACSVCNRPIKAFRAAMIAWDMALEHNRPEGLFDTANVLHPVHKDFASDGVNCLSTIEQRIKTANGRLGTIELSTFLDQLSLNSGKDDITPSTR